MIVNNNYNDKKNHYHYDEKKNHYHYNDDNYDDSNI